jgi:3-oxocholest-4-en-26-oate---CoA ligase
VVAIIAIVAGHTVTVGEIQTHCRNAIAAFKVPKDVLFVEEVQRTAAGKPDYLWAAALAASTDADSQGIPK